MKAYVPLSTVRARIGKKPEMSPGAALRLLQSSLADERTETPSEGFLSVEQWASAWEKSIRHTRDLLKSAVKRGLAERKILKQRAGNVQFFRFLAPQ